MPIDPRTNGTTASIHSPAFFSPPSLPHQSPQSKRLVPVTKCTPFLRIWCRVTSASTSSTFCTRCKISFMDDRREDVNVDFP